MDTQNPEIVGKYVSANAVAFILNINVMTVYALMRGRTGFSKIEPLPSHRVQSRWNRYGFLVDEVINWQRRTGYVVRIRGRHAPDRRPVTFINATPARVKLLQRAKA